MHPGHAGHPLDERVERETAEEDGVGPERQGGQHVEPAADAPVDVDLGDALDGVPSPVLYDFVHTNEAGARAVAQRLYAELRPTLRRLDEPR